MTSPPLKASRLTVVAMCSGSWPNDPSKKATILNKQFTVVFTTEDTADVSMAHISGEKIVRPFPFDEGVELLRVVFDRVSHVRLVSLPTFVVLLFLKVFVPLEVICCP